MLTKTDRKVGREELREYFATLASLLSETYVSNAAGETVELDEAICQFMDQARAVHAAGNKLIFVGNGGSATIASHMATDFSKNGLIRTTALNDASMLTCLANDYSYEWVFAKQIEFYAQPGDLLIAISSSGRSANILKAVEAARKARCGVVTFSGFTSDNPLRVTGDLNFYVAADRYGFVEIAHLTICHAVLDFICNLRFPADFGKSRPGGGMARGLV
jgi:D-sedoheptulose 7-phosphate isomerase